MKQANVFYNNTKAGILIENDEGAYEFIYDEQYLVNSSMPSISVNLPKNNRHYRSKILFPFFYNMLSEGANRKIQCRILKIDEEDDFELLIKTAAHETIGAITVQEINEQ